MIFFRIHCLIWLNYPEGATQMPFQGIQVTSFGPELVADLMFFVHGVFVSGFRVFGGNVAYCSCLGSFQNMHVEEKLPFPKFSKA